MRPATRALLLACGLAALTLGGFVVPLVWLDAEAGARAGAWALSMCLTWLCDSPQSTAEAGICLLLSLLMAGLVRGAVSLVSQRRSTSRFVDALGSLDSQPAEGAEVVDSGEVFALCHGLWRPRVALSRGLVELLSRDELEAVLLHERHHQAYRDPLKTLLARSLAGAFFFVPVVSELVERYLQLKELDADQAAILAQRDRLPMASAFCKVARASHSMPHPAIAIGALLSPSADRIAQLTDGSRPRWRPSRRALALSVVVFGLQLAVGLAAGGMQAFQVMPAVSSGVSAQGIAWALMCCGLLVALVRFFGGRTAAAPTR